MSGKIATILSLFLIISCICFASVKSPGSVSDPLISKSYVDNFLSFRPVELKTGTYLKPDAGGLVILLSGKIRYVSKTGKELSDLTSGKTVRAGAYLSPNHLHIVVQNADYELQVKEDSLVMIFGVSDANLNLKNDNKN